MVGMNHTQTLTVHGHPVTVWGRPVKPVLGFMTVAMLILVVINLQDSGILGPSEWGDLIAAFALTAATLSVAAWWANSQAMVEAALLGIMWVWLFRFFAGSFTVGLSLEREGVWFSLLWAGVAGTSWWIERSDGRT